MTILTLSFGLIEGEMVSSLINDCNPQVVSMREMTKNRQVNIDSMVNNIGLLQK